MTYKILLEQGLTLKNGKGFEYTGELIEIKNGNNEGEILRVVKGKFTPSGGVRDCGDYYIKANYSSYDRINKTTMQAIKDVEDI